MLQTQLGVPHWCMCCIPNAPDTTGGPHWCMCYIPDVPDTTRGSSLVYVIFPMLQTPLGVPHWYMCCICYLLHFNSTNFNFSLSNFILLQCSYVSP